MIKWIRRIIGIIVILVFFSFFYEDWFNPEVPEQLKVHLPEAADTVQDIEPPIVIAADDAASSDEENAVENETTTAVAKDSIAPVESLGNILTSADPVTKEDNIEKNNFFLQVGAFSNIKNANNRLAVLKKNNIDAKVLPSKNDHLHHVYVELSTEQQLSNTEKKLNQLKIDFKKIPTIYR